MPSNHLILCHPLLLLPSIVPRIRDIKSKKKTTDYDWKVVLLVLRTPLCALFNKISSFPGYHHLGYFLTQVNASLEFFPSGGLSEEGKKEIQENIQEETRNLRVQGVPWFPLKCSDLSWGDGSPLSGWGLPGYLGVQSLWSRTSFPWRHWVKCSSMGNANTVPSRTVGRALSDILKMFAPRPLSHKGRFHC